MKILYHGSPHIVSEPKIIKNPKRIGDYGYGFYCTTSLEQAKRWALNHVNLGETAYVNVYEVSEEELNKLRSLTYDVANEDWVDFVENNRRNKSYIHDLDVVIGPVADDRVNTSFSLYEQRVITKQQLIQNLKTYRLKNQVLFHTEKSLTAIKFKRAIEVSISPSNNKNHDKSRSTSKVPSRHSRKD